jgi:hypothetical protein
LPEGEHHDAQHHITAKQLHCEATSLRSNITFPSGKISSGIAAWFFFLFVLTNKAGCITLIPVRFNTLNYPLNIIQGGSL